MDSNGGALEQASSVDSKVTIHVEDNDENATIASVKHPASEQLALACYIVKYPALFVPQFLGMVEKQRNQGTTENAEDGSVGTGIIGRMVNSNMLENASISESVEELHAINSLYVSHTTSETAIPYITADQLSLCSYRTIKEPEIQLV
jgi:hypothetical protein